MAAHVPVVISDQCGAAADLVSEAGLVLPLTSTVESWAQALVQQLGRRDPVPCFVRGWRDVALDYERIYCRAFLNKTQIAEPMVYRNL